MGLDNFFVSYMYNKNNLFNYGCVLLLFSNLKLVFILYIQDRILFRVILFGLRYKYIYLGYDYFLLFDWLIFYSVEIGKDIFYMLIKIRYV